MLNAILILVGAQHQLVALVIIIMAQLVTTNAANCRISLLLELVLSMRWFASFFEH